MSCISIRVFMCIYSVLQFIAVLIIVGLRTHPVHVYCMFAVCCSVLYVYLCMYVVCCSVLQCAVTVGHHTRPVYMYICIYVMWCSGCSVLQCAVAEGLHTLSVCVYMYVYSVLHCVAVWCSVVQCGAL